VRIFISYSSPDRQIAEEIQLALLGEGHDVFYDKDSLPAGGNYHARISNAIALANAFIFLISPDSITPGSYALTELKFVRSKWPHPNGRVLPVRLLSTPWENIPAYLKSVTVLEPSGNIAAEVLDAVTALPSRSSQPTPGSVLLSGTTGNDQSASTTASSSKVQVWIAVISLIGVLGAATITNWDKLFRIGQPVAAPSPAAKESQTNLGGLKGSDTTAQAAPVLNTQCPEVTFTDYSKFPAESMIVRRCDP